MINTHPECRKYNVELGLPHHNILTLGTVTRWKLRTSVSLFDETPLKALVRAVANRSPPAIASGKCKCALKCLYAWTQSQERYLIKFHPVVLCQRTLSTFFPSRDIDDSIFQQIVVKYPPFHISRESSCPVISGLSWVIGCAPSIIPRCRK